jgi:hypothetical protein
VYNDYVRETREETPVGQGFQQWMHQVDQTVQGKVGLSVHDLEDCPFMDWFKDGVKPASAATRAIRNAGGDF